MNVMAELVGSIADVSRAGLLLAHWVIALLAPVAVLAALGARLWPAFACTLTLWLSSLAYVVAWWFGVLPRWAGGAAVVVQVVAVGLYSIAFRRWYRARGQRPPRW